MAIRSFLAFPISGELKEEFKRIINELQPTHADVKWVKLENIHLTLKFLGSLQGSDLENVSSVLRDRAPGFFPITTYLSEIGAFPDFSHPKIIWGALDDPSNKIHTIVNVLEGELSKFGIAKDDHPFKPHITLGRIRSSANLSNLIQVIQQITLKVKTKQIFERVILYKSTLTSQGPVYEVLKEFVMGAPD